MRVLPPDGECLVHLDILAGLHATPAQDALVRVVSVKGIRVVDLVRLGLEWPLLVLDPHHPGGVVYRAVPVIIVAHRAVEEMVSQDPVKGIPLRRACQGGLRGDIHSLGHHGPAGPQ
jgi:hypothetical protein